MDKPNLAISSDVARYVRAKIYLYQNHIFDYLAAATCNYSDKQRVLNECMGVVAQVLGNQQVDEKYLIQLAWVLRDIDELATRQGEENANRAQESQRPAVTEDPRQRKFGGDFNSTGSPTQDVPGDSTPSGA